MTYLVITVETLSCVLNSVSMQMVFYLRHLDKKKAVALKSCIHTAQFSAASYHLLPLVVAWMQSICNPATLKAELWLKRCHEAAKLCFFSALFQQKRDEKRIIWIKFPPSEPFTSSLLTRATLGGSVAKQVTVCFKSFPDASFSQMRMRNRTGGPSFSATVK